VVQYNSEVGDLGYTELERLLKTVEVKSRGGTILMPGIDRLQSAADFPKDAPILSECIL
jgi:hypothetical protein